MKRPITLIFAILVFRAPLRAETLKAGALLRHEAGGKDVVRTSSDIRAERSASGGEYRLTGFTVYLDTRSFDAAGSAVRKGAALYDSRGREIGRALEDFSQDYPVYGPAPGTSRIEADMALLARGADIEPGSVVETALAAGLSAAKGAPLKADLNSHIGNFGYRKWKGYAGVESYGVYEGWMEDPSPGFRVLLVFRRGKLAAVLHSRPVPFQFRSGKKFSRGLELSYPARLPAKEAEKLEKFYSSALNAAD
ncbi:MAG: hypothetical protein M0025_12005 [Elusimicrobia bacterium]|nr:hypothetical protein [Elusimicrobiota bacterium]MDA8244825.1 hypothetical protein [Elusimicrobiota bacterium]